MLLDRSSGNIGGAAQGPEKKKGKEKKENQIDHCNLSVEIYLGENVLT